MIKFIYKCADTLGFYLALLAVVVICVLAAAIIIPLVLLVLIISLPVILIIIPLMYVDRWLTLKRRY